MMRRVDHASTRNQAAAIKLRKGTPASRASYRSATLCAGVFGDAVDWRFDALCAVAVANSSVRAMAALVRRATGDQVTAAICHHSAHAVARALCGRLAGAVVDALGAFPVANLARWAGATVVKVSEGHVEGR